MDKFVFTVFSSAFASCYLLLPILAKIAAKKGLVTCQTPGKADKRAVPYIGGVGIFLVL